MRKLIGFALLAIAGFCSANRLSAQEHVVQGQIPFDFTAGSARLSAGEYRISYEVSGLVRFHNLDHGNSVMMFVGTDPSVNDGACRLVFTRYEGQYFLKQSACGAANVNFSLPVSRREKQTQERAASHHSGEQTVVAMR